MNFSRQLTMDEYNELKKIHDDDHRNDIDKKPDYYCQWEPTQDGRSLVWDGGEKFYSYVEWMYWLIENFFKPKEIILNGSIDWEGEDRNDIGKIIVNNNELKIAEGRQKIVFNEMSYEEYIKR